MMPHLYISFKLFHLTVFELEGICGDRKTHPGELSASFCCEFVLAYLLVLGRFSVSLSVSEFDRAWTPPGHMKAALCIYTAFVSFTFNT